MSMVWLPVADFFADNYNEQLGGPCVRVSLLDQAAHQMPAYSYQIGWKSPNGYTIHFSSQNCSTPDAIVECLTKALAFITREREEALVKIQARREAMIRMSEEKERKKEAKKKRHNENVERRRSLDKARTDNAKHGNKEMR